MIIHYRGGGAIVRLRDEEKERRILEGSLGLIERQGLAALSMEGVAKEAGIAIGTVYVYFESKEALINALYVHDKQAFAREVLLGATDTEPVRPAFERMSIAYIRYVQKNRAQMMFLSQVRNSPLLKEKTIAQTSTVVAPLHALLERGKAEGLLKKDMPTALMIAFVQATLAELSAYVSVNEPKKSQAERYTQIAQMAWDALKL